MLNTQPEAERGKHVYSNAGYTIAGHMLKRVSGLAWEALIQDELFSPLSMNNTGLGPPNFDQSIGQVSGHYFSNGRWIARKPSDGVHIPFVMGPAGTVNADYAMGWGSFDVDWSSGKILTHGGSNSFCLAEWMIAPEEGFAIMVIFNATGENVTQAQGKLLAILVDRYAATL